MPTVEELGQRVKAKYRGTYDDLADAEVGRRVKSKYPGSYDDFTDAPPAQREPGIFETVKAAAGSALDLVGMGAPSGPPQRTLPSQAFLSAFRQKVSPVEQLKGLATAVSQPVETGKAMLEAQGRLGGEAAEAFRQGDYLKAARKGLHYALPVIGPELDVAAEKMAGGRVAEGLGEAAGTAANIAAPYGLSKVKSIPIKPGITNPNPTEAAAMAFLEKEGVPVSAAAKTGSPYVRGVQKLADTTPIGAYVAGKSEAQTARAMQSAADRIADRAAPLPVVAEQAGSGVRSAIEGRVTGFKNVADRAYENFRQAEANPANMRPVTTGPGITQNMPLPVDLRQIKAELKPVYDHMTQWMQPAKRQASAGFTALESIINGPDYVPASVAEAGLSGLKQLSREGTGRSAGLGKFAVPKLQQAVDDAVAHADPNAIRALQRGRAAVAKQYGVKEILEQLREEPVQVFNQLTWQKDAGIDFLREVAKQAPREMPRIGRAYLEGLFSKATEGGGFDRTAGLWQQWNNLGTQTKKVLFSDPQLVSDLNKLFLGAKKMAENPNPSGTAVVGFIAGQSGAVIYNPTIGIPYVLGAGALSKMLHSPRGVRLLTEGMKVSGKDAASAAITAQILKMAGDDAQPIGQPQYGPPERQQQQLPR